nr:hypothetical protein [Mycobacterium intracellulare]
MTAALRPLLAVRVVAAAVTLAVRTSFLMSAVMAHGQVLSVIGIERIALPPLITNDGVAMVPAEPRMRQFGGDMDRRSAAHQPDRSKPFLRTARAQGGHVATTSHPGRDSQTNALRDGQRRNRDISTSTKPSSAGTCWSPASTSADELDDLRKTVRGFVLRGQTMKYCQDLWTGEFQATSDPTVSAPPSTVRV